MSTPSFSEWWDDPESPIPTLWLRNIFTTVFLICNYIIMFLGARFIKRRAQRHIAKHESVPVTHMTPWFPLFSTLLYIWQFRKLPGGIIGLLMIASGIFAILNNFIVNSFISDTNLLTTCFFESGLIADFGDSAPSTSLRPAALWPVSFLALRALESVGKRGGRQGVYSKIDYNFDTGSTTFMPTEDDLLGEWNCDKSSNVTFLYSDILNQTILTAAIVGQNLHYDQAQAGFPSTMLNGTISNYIYWSADHDDDNTSPVWQMNATVGVDLHKSLSATNYHCSYTASKKQWQAPIMPLQNTLLDWGGLMLGYTYDSTIQDAKPNLERILNSMTMVAASGNRIHQPNEDKLPSYFYGCVARRPTIRPPVYIVLLILVVLIIGLLIIDLYNLVMNCFSGRRKIVDNMPFDIVEWQLAAMQLLTGEEKLKYRGIKEYEYLHDKDTAKFMARKMELPGGRSYAALNTSEISAEMKINPKSKEPTVSVVRV